MYRLDINHCKCCCWWTHCPTVYYTLSHLANTENTYTYMHIFIYIYISMNIGISFSSVFLTNVWCPTSLSDWRFGPWHSMICWFQIVFLWHHVTYTEALMTAVPKKSISLSLSSSSSVCEGQFAMSGTHENLFLFVFSSRFIKRQKSSGLPEWRLLHDLLAGGDGRAHILLREGHDGSASATGASAWPPEGRAGRKMIQYNFS